jgi:transcriptional regulator with XRE-family HTH domain
VIYGEKIRKARLKNRMKQEELAEIIGVHQTAISQYERGTRNPTLKILDKICDVLEINASEVMEKNEIKNKTKNFSSYEMCEVFRFIDFIIWKRNRKKD